MFGMQRGTCFRRLRHDNGFTLIELMIVVLVIAILIAIAIPTFIGARRRAQDRAAQSSLRYTVTAARALYGDRESYQPVTMVELESMEQSLDFDIASSIDHNTVSIVDPPTTRFIFAAAAKSDSGTCWFIRDYMDESGTNAGTRWAKDVGVAIGACDGATAEGVADGLYAARRPNDAIEVTP